MQLHPGLYGRRSIHLTKKKNIAKSGSTTPRKRPAQPEEIAAAYVFLASPQYLSYITGEILPIIGGYKGV
jgi:NAD(P)-dependent dehydrogenase (short-subunit alcohol dehydrogenase family)